MNNHVPPHRPEETYSQGFWYAIIAAILYMICSMILMVNMLGYFTGHYQRHFALTHHQRTLMLQTMLFFFWLAGGAAVFARTCDLSYVDALYFADVTVLTVGFGDITPPNDVGRGMVLPFSVGGIIMLGLMVNSIHRFARELGEDKVIKRHTEKARIHTVGRSVTTSLDLRRHQGGEEERPRLPSEVAPAKRSDRVITWRDPTGRRMSVADAPEEPAEGSLTKTNTAEEVPGMGKPLSRTNTAKDEDAPMPGLRRAITNRVSAVGTTVVRRVRNKPKLILLREEKDRFDAMRLIQHQTTTFKRWYNLGTSTVAFGLLWCVGAIVFWKVEVIVKSFP